MLAALRSQSLQMEADSLHHPQLVNLCVPTHPLPQTQSWKPVFHSSLRNNKTNCQERSKPHQVSEGMRSKVVSSADIEQKQNPTNMNTDLSDPASERPTCDAVEKGTPHRATGNLTVICTILQLGQENHTIASSVLQGTHFNTDQDQTQPVTLEKRLHHITQTSLKSQSSFLSMKSTGTPGMSHTTLLT